MEEVYENGRKLGHSREIVVRTKTSGGGERRQNSKDLDIT